MTTFKQNDCGIDQIWIQDHDAGTEDERYVLWWRLSDGDEEIYCESGHKDYIENIYGLLIKQYNLEVQKQC